MMEEDPERPCDGVQASDGAVANVPQLVSCQVKGSAHINVTTRVRASANSEQSQHADSSSGKAGNTARSDILQLSERLKISLQKKFERIFEGLAKRGNQTLLKSIYTQLYIIEGERYG